MAKANSITRGTEEVENVDLQSISKTPDQLHRSITEDEPAQMRSQEDDVSVWESIKQHKLLTLVAMSTAFSASLDGYRKLLQPDTLRRLGC